ncbi:DUF2806 domain-containing protein [Bradyrhizobium neotropicale]|uniref:DUF2806 domain-containing protein n=1 Tax=Bradyrhizobium neotropicale TaxID=1497615 RepID=A0A176Z183_9BRAD|nr:DUF2806 domain-containing protein [Bradyrhizobium neotropicale]OAF14129.1 hypothetical protein AXW67_00600 [Bradyrhizobium neotropicale]
MGNDVVPSEGGGFLDQLNLPKIVAGPAGEAISRLIGGAVDIPAAWLASVTQRIKDKTEARSVVSKAVADAAASLAKNDPEVIQRAAHSLLTKELRHQTNREEIARKTIEYLGEDPPAQTAKPDDDWLNVFERYAEDASSERLQDLWGRIFAGELRKPKAFSLRTLRFVAELDENVVALFEKWSPRVVNADFIAFPSQHGVEFTELLQLEECGLITGATGSLSKSFDAGSLPDGQIASFGFQFKKHLLLVHARAPVNLQVQNVLLTTIGREIYAITRTPAAMEPVQDFANRLPKHNLLEIVCYPLEGGAAGRLWSKPEEPSSVNQTPAERA